jgi:zinc/manganese transport system permease protein
VTLSLAWDPLFRAPLATGLLLAVALPLLGACLRIREQWFSGLGIAQLAAAGGVAGALLHGPVALFAVFGGALGGLARLVTRSTRNEHYAVMLLGGWAAVMLLARFGHDVNMTAMHLLNGQLYFTALPHLAGAATLLGAILWCGHWLARRLLLARLFPGHFSANRAPAWPHELCLEALLVGGVVLGISTMGVMAAFAMLFVPPWIAFRLARGWMPALLVSAAVGVLSFLLGFSAALALDLPFGPALVAALLLAMPLRLVPFRLSRPG